MLSVIKGDAFKKLIITNNGETKTYIYNNFNEFINILKENYYSEILYSRNFKQ